MNSPARPKPLDRIQENLLARNERRLLTAICARLPASVTPDKLTSLGLFGGFLIGLGYVLSAYNPVWLWLSVFAYFLHWFGDSLDGSLARYRHIERPRFGYFIDHSVDVIGTLMIIGGLGLSPFVRFDIAMIALVGYFMMSIHAFLAARVLGELKLSYVAAGPTELRLLLITLTIAMYVTGWHNGDQGQLTPFDWLVGAVGAFLMMLFLYQTLTTAARIKREGEAPQD
nr:CDP-alcohol phosphatidyltransferase family protein [uncultured Sphingomonas sp.]